MHTVTVPAHSRYSTAIPDEVRAVLQRARIEGTRLFLTEQLARPLYEAVNKVLKIAGGKWTRQTQAHTFPADPRDILGLALQTGQIEDKQKKYQAYFTPDAVAEAMVTWANIGPAQHVLEPSAGGGAIARAIRRAWANVHCVEIQEDLAEELGKTYPTSNRDFLTMPAAPTYDAVLMNPPFANHQDIKHVMHALKFLKPGGVLVSIMWAFTHGTHQIQKDFRELVDAQGDTMEIPEGEFKESGTNVRTVMVKICP